MDRRQLWPGHAAAAADTLLMLEFEQQDAQLVPMGQIYSISYGQRLSFYGLENLVEKLERIYELLGISQAFSENWSCPEDGRFFVMEECLKNPDCWSGQKCHRVFPQPRAWKNCLMLVPLGYRGACWQGTVVWKGQRLGYSDCGQLKELLARCWLEIKRNVFNRPLCGRETDFWPGARERPTGSCNIDRKEN